MNIRPYTNALRKAWPDVWRKQYDSVAGGGRTVSLVGLFRGIEPVLPIVPGTPVKTGDRLLDIQLDGDGWHRISHMVVTRDGVLMANPSAPKADPSPAFLRGTTHPTKFPDPDGMLTAIWVELRRKDHKP